MPKDSTLKATANPPDDVLAEIATSISISSLNANADHPARLANLTQANLTSTFNRGAQNAVANQQAHAQLNLSVVGQAVQRVQSIDPLAARAGVDVLTNDEAAQTIADLKSVLVAFGRGGGAWPVPPLPPLPPVRWHNLLRLLRTLLREIEGIMKMNQHVQGDGTMQNPFVVTGGPLFVRAPVTIAFYRVPPGQLSLEALRGMFGVR